MYRISLLYNIICETCTHIDLASRIIYKSDGRINIRDKMFYVNNLKIHEVFSRKL